MKSVCCIARKAFTCGPSSNGTVIYELQEKIPVLGSGSHSSPSGMLRSGDVWLAILRRYGDLKQVLVPMIWRGKKCKLAVHHQPTG